MINILQLFTYIFVFVISVFVPLIEKKFILFYPYIGYRRFVCTQLVTVLEPL